MFKNHARKSILQVFLIFSFTIFNLTGCKIFFSSPPENTYKTFYIRYDVQSRIHTLSDENFIMVPTGDEFRKKEFSYFSIPCVISMTPNESKNERQLRAKQHALKMILKSKGLKSVFSKNLITIIGYEGFINEPIQIKNIKLQDAHFISYVADISFCPVAFPDEWKHLKNRYLIKKKLHDFLSLFY